MTSAKYGSRELILTRVYDAPRELMFKLWTDPKHMAKWWGPFGFTNPVCKLDVRPGGKILIHMRSPEGQEHPMGGHFIEVKEPERLVFLAVAQDAEGKTQLESHTTVTFEAQGKKTKLTVKASALGFVPLAKQMLEGMEAGWSQSLEKLDSLAINSSDREASHIRVYQAPRELVWKAWTDPKHLVNWFGPAGFKNTFHQFDLRPGGVWLFTMHGPDGTDYENKVVFLEIEKPYRLVYDHGDGKNPPLFRTTVTLTEVPGMTILNMRGVFQSVEAFEAVKKNGAMEGGRQTLDKLGEELKKMV
jgi:uncharacterized protein YndB with AHSA1/START domain